MIAKKMGDIDSEDDLIQAFVIFDSNRTGYITTKEFRDVMMNLGERLTYDEVTEMIIAADKNSTGRINYRGMLQNLNCFFYPKLQPIYKQT